LTYTPKPYLRRGRLYVPYLKNDKGITVGWKVISVEKTKKWIEQNGGVVN
jgi:hypothetical protein